VEKPIQLLVLEGDPAQAAQINDQLRNLGLSFQFDRAATPEEFRERLQRCVPDVIILDHAGAAFGHTEALKLAKEKCPDIPCISLLGPEGEQAVIQEFKRGVTDCVLKDHLEVLGEAVQQAVDNLEARSTRRDGTCQDKLLRQAEQNLQLFVRAAKDYAIYMLDPQGHVVSWNEGAQRIEGYRPEEIIGKYFGIFFTPEEAAGGLPERELDRAMTQGHSHTAAWAVRADGSRFWSEWGLTSVHDEGGRLRGFLKVAHDMTARKEAEDRVQSLNNELEQRVRERTAQLEASNRDLEAFAYSISHDLQAPLRHVRTFAQQLEKESVSLLPATSREYLEIILRSAHTMTEMVGALLRFSRVGRSQITWQPLDLNQLIEQVQRELQLELSGRQVEWHIEKLPSVAGDPLLLRQVFFNLLSNALKYTSHRREARIEVAGTKRPSSGSFLSVITAWVSTWITPRSFLESSSAFTRNRNLRARA
jgi:PAS domain S-box-containing protein